MKQFPEYPQDPQALTLLKGFEILSSEITNSADTTPTLNKCAGYLYVLGTAPIHFHRFYFDLFKHLKDDIDRMSEDYNRYIYRRGQNYMLELLNQEIGEFGKYFNQFQLLMYSVNERANWDERIEPLSRLLWGFYISLYNEVEREEYLDKTYSFVERSHRLHRATINN